jgi:pimeloyl-ACP methyl ester carboxylesterase
LPVDTIRSEFVIGLLSSHPVLTALLTAPPLLGLLAVLYLAVRYTPVVGRHFQAQPLFLPLKVSPLEQGESVQFTTEDGFCIRGTFLRARNDGQAGVIVYCHEYLSDRWSFYPYADHLRDLGYDLFTFDFRNHGASDVDPSYAPTQWTTDHEVRDLRAALAYLRTREDHDPAGFGLFGVSRGGTASLLAAAGEPDVWGVITDGAFPTQGTMVPYIVRWAEIYVPNRFLRGLIPHSVFGLLAWTGRQRTERLLNCRFPSVEAAVARLAPRPWLMIHGQLDAYIGPDIARALFEYGKEPKELWLVKNAKHNRCRESDPDAYAARIVAWLDHFAPRRPLYAATEVVPAQRGLTGDFVHQLTAAAHAREVATPIPG